MISDVGKLDKHSPELLILLIDVGQGESTLIVETQNGQSLWAAVIDGGYSVQGRGALTRYLKALGITRLDAIICTHFDGDHTKGLTSFLIHQAQKAEKEKSKKSDKIEVAKLYVRNAEEDQFKSSTKLHLLKAAKDLKVDVETIGKALKTTRKEFQINVVYSSTEAFQDENLGSIALVIEYGPFRYYTAGDLPSVIEETLVKKIGKLDAFKCGHHGSAGSTPLEFIAGTEPAIALISCGQQSFGHPSYDVLERLMHPGSTVQAIYLTNCIHNRRIANPDFEKNEYAIAAKLQKDLQSFNIEILNKEGAYSENLVAAALKGISKIEEEEKRRFVRKRLQAAQRSIEHINKKILGDTAVHVGGSETRLGTIVLRVPFQEQKVKTKAEVEVGLEVADKWKWLDRSGKVIKSTDEAHQILGKLIMKAIFKKGELVHDPHSPQKMQQYTKKRTEQYSRFTEPTIAGHHAREGKQSVPFCTICKLELEYDASGDILQLVKLECSGQKEDIGHVHVECLRSLGIEIKFIENESAEEDSDDDKKVDDEEDNDDSNDDKKVDDEDDDDDDSDDDKKVNDEDDDNDDVILSDMKAKVDYCHICLGEDVDYEKEKRNKSSKGRKVDDDYEKMDKKEFNKRKLIDEMMKKFVDNRHYCHWCGKALAKSKSSGLEFPIIQVLPGSCGCLQTKNSKLYFHKECLVQGSYKCNICGKKVSLS